MQRPLEPTMQQLDIFNDSRDVQLRNDLATAVAAFDTAAALQAQQALAAEYPDDAALPAAGLLIDSLPRAADAGDGPFSQLADALAAREQLQARLTPAAQALLGSQGSGPWLCMQWQRLAERAHALPYRADQADGHAAALWLQAGAWAQAAAAVQRIESWRRIPQPLAWMLQALWRAGDPTGPEAAWPLLAELCWLAPGRAARTLPALPGTALNKRLQRFEAEFDAAGVGDGDNEHWAWFPAWLLVDQPLLAEPLITAQASRGTAAERSFSVMQSLLRLERQGRHHDVVAHRRELLGLSAPLFAAYMKTR
jgi:hypothetical protein